MINEWAAKDLETDGHGLFEVLSKNLLGETEENHKKPESE
jgi:hypothetical protein